MERERRSAVTTEEREQHKQREREEREARREKLEQKQRERDARKELYLKNAPRRAAEKAAKERAEAAKERVRLNAMTKRKKQLAAVLLPEVRAFMLSKGSIPVDCRDVLHRALRGPLNAAVEERQFHLPFEEQDPHFNQAMRNHAIDMACVVTDGRYTLGRALVVDEATNDDNSVDSLAVRFGPSSICEELNFLRGDTVLVKGKRGKDTMCITIPDETCEPDKVRVNEYMRKSLKVQPGDVVSLHECPDIKYGKRVHILPIDDTIIGIRPDDLRDVFLVPYFKDACRPVRKNGLFVCHRGMRAVEFKVVETDPEEYCIVGPHTVRT